MSENSTPTRSRADRIGQLVFVLIVCGGLAALDVWLGTLYKHYWWFWVAEVPALLLWAMLLASGLVASLGGRGRRR